LEWRIQYVSKSHFPGWMELLEEGTRGFLGLALLRFELSGLSRSFGVKLWGMFGVSLVASCHEEVQEHIDIYLYIAVIVERNAWYITTILCADWIEIILLD
jgi:hypothetical protein